MWLLSADCAPPACATEDSMRLVPGWQSADTALPRDVAGRAWAAGSRTVSGSGGADAVALALCVAEDSSELWGCLPPSAGTASGPSVSRSVFPHNCVQSNGSQRKDAYQTE